MITNQMFKDVCIFAFAEPGAMEYIKELQGNGRDC